jgi:putative peptidoglycan lipid II flippase
MTRWMFPYIGCMSLVALSAGILNTWRKFALPAFTPLLLNLAVISAALIGVPWFKRLGIEPVYALAMGTMLGGVLQLAIQVPALWRLGMLPRLAGTPGGLKRAWAHPGLRQMLGKMGPAVIGVSVSQLSLLINSQIASRLGEGAISTITYADRLMELPIAILGVALGVVLTPQLSAAQARDDGVQYSGLLDWGLRLTLLLALPCAVALLLFAQPMVATLFHRGAFTAAAVANTSAAVMGYGVGLLGLVGVKVVAPGYYARQDMTTPMRVGIMVMVLTQVFNALLLPWLGTSALTLSLGLAALVNAGWLLRGLKRLGSWTPTPGWAALVLRVVVASALMGGFLHWTRQQFDWIALGQHELQRVATLAALIFAAIGLYFGALAASGLNLRQLWRRTH